MEYRLRWVPGVGSLRWACTFHVLDDANLTRRQPVFWWNMGFTILGKEVSFVKKYNYLGILLDSELSLDRFYKSIIKKVNNKIYSLRKIRRYISFDVAIQIYKQTILPYFNYGGFLAMSLNKEKKYDLQIMQNDILRICNNTKLSDRVSIEKLH